MAECKFRDHLWEPRSNTSPFEDEVTLACAVCGVGHSVVFDKRVPGRVTTALTIFPSTGSRTISRSVIRWSILSHEANLSDIRETGVEVIEEPSTIEGVAGGD